MDKNTIPCPLCKASNTEVFNKPQNTLNIYFYRCLTCELVFKSASEHISIENEKIRYEQHNNDVTDQRYLNYLKQLWDCGPKGRYKSILDYGCGPSKGLEALLAGECVESFDPIFYPINLELNSFDLVFCCEVVEHFNSPRHSWRQLVGLVSSGGILLVRTETYKKENFENWYYKDDPTHVCFYNSKTLEWIAQEFGLKLLDSFDGNKFTFKKL